MSVCEKELLDVTVKLMSLQISFIKRVKNSDFQNNALPNQEWSNNRENLHKYQINCSADC